MFVPRVVSIGASKATQRLAYVDTYASKIPGESTEGEPSLARTGAGSTCPSLNHLKAPEVLPEHASLARSDAVAF